MCAMKTSTNSRWSNWNGSTPRWTYSNYEVMRHGSHLGMK